MEDEIEKLKNELIDKLQKEFSEYKQNLSKEKPENIIEKSRETAAKEAIIECYDFDMWYTNEELKALLKEQSLLEQSYQEWRCCDANFRDVLDVPLENLVDIIMEDAKREKAKSKKDKAR